MDDLYLDRIRLPREIFIPNSSIMSIIKNNAEILDIDEGTSLWDILVNESMLILISDNPDRLTIETPEMLDFISYNNNIERYRSYRHSFVAAARNYLTRVEQLRIAWKEHSDPYLTWGLSDDRIMIVVKFTPVYPTRNYDEILRREVNAAVEAGEFVPFKYLRVLGLC